MRPLALLCAVMLGVSSPGATASSAIRADADGDGMPNRWERVHGLNPNRPNAAGDPDRDRLRNLDEYLLGGHPKKRDTDGDGLWDGGEARKWGSEVNVGNTLVGTARGFQVCLVDGSACGHVPIPGAVVVLRDSTGTVVERLIADTAGRYSTTLAAGDYSFDALAPPGFNAPDSREVTLTSAALKSHVTFGNVIRGVVGQARVGPTCGGPQRPYEDCVAPLEGATIEIRDAAGASVATVTTDDTGRYAFSLDPGDFTLVAHPVGDQGLPAAPAPVDFTIAGTDEGPRLVDSDYDSGIR